MALVFTNDNNRVIYWYQDDHILPPEIVANGIYVPTENMQPPATEPWENAVPMVSLEGVVTWVLEELPEDDPSQLERKLAQYELPGEHIFNG